MTQSLIVDQYSAYNYKPMFRDRLVGTAPTWVGDDNRRRIEAYILLASYLENTAREYLQNDLEKDARREYGDPSLIVQTLTDAVLGDDTRISVDGARRRDMSDLDDDAQRVESQVDPFADRLQDFFDEWIDSENLLMTVMEAEEDAIGLGDGVFEIAWDGKRNRVTVVSYDPGFYFPVLDPAEAVEQFPSKIHLAWEYEKWDPIRQTKHRFVRRITYELEEVEGGSFSYPWNAETTNVRCLKSDGTWEIRDVGSKTWLDLDESRARWATNADGDEVHNLDLNIDFIPIVHLPNTISRKEHFGRSALQKVLQIIDDIQSTDTDLLKTSRTTGSPPLGSKSPVDKTEDGTVTTYGPGQIIVGEVTVIDTSRNLDALLKYIDELLKRLSTNVRMPESVLGKLRPSEVPSGIALALSFGPLRSLVRRMRLARVEKYPILLKFVHRFMMLQDSELVTTEAPRIDLAFGQFLPSDRAAIIEDITNLHREQLLSRNTAIQQIIRETNIDIKDAQEEVAAIEVEDFEGARILGDALESPEAAAEYVQRKIPAMSDARKDAIEAEAAARPAPFGGGGQPQGNGNKPDNTSKSGGGPPKGGTPDAA